jgi:glyoxylase-like metal-dependent hydrolase (beta-lactamase superfamily II)
MKTFEEIAVGVYLISAGRANSYLLVGDDLTLVDTGLPGEEDGVIAGIEKIGRKPNELSHILITHAHMDHMGSVAALKKVSGAQVVASSKEVNYIGGARKTWTMGREGLAGKLFKGALYLLETFSFTYEPVPVDMPCQGGEVIDCFGGMQVIATPGHSRGSLSYYQHERKILFTGDALSGTPQLRLPPRLGCADYREALTSVGKLAELDVEICLFGHGSPLKTGASKLVKQLLQGIAVAPE